MRNEDIDGRDCEHRNDDEVAQYVLNVVMITSKAVFDTCAIELVSKSAAPLKLTLRG